MLIYPKDYIKITALYFFQYPLFISHCILIKSILRFFSNHLLLSLFIHTLNYRLSTSKFYETHTLCYLGLTLSLRPRAAATKNKIRIAEKAFIYFIRVKINSRGGVILQIFLTLLMGLE